MSDGHNCYVCGRHLPQEKCLFAGCAFCSACFDSLMRPGAGHLITTTPAVSSAYLLGGQEAANGVADQLLLERAREMRTRNGLP